MAMDPYAIIDGPEFNAFWYISVLRVDMIASVLLQR